MAGAIPKEFVEQLRQRSNIVDVIGEHVQLRKSGRNYSGLCPFHQEKTPSFSVNPEKQFYYCFGCQASGDVLQFVREHKRLDFGAALRYLANRIGMPLPRESEAHSRARQSFKPLYDLLEEATRFYEIQLHKHPHSVQAREYLAKRQLSAEILSQFHIGYAPPAWDLLLRKLQTENPRQLRPAERLGLLKKRDRAPGKKQENEYYDYFRNRILFPIRDTRGRTVGFGGRALREGDHPKYLNSPETPLFHKRSLLYGLYEALQVESRPQRLLLVEGYTDVLTLAQHGMSCAVAALGVALSREHLELALRFSPELVFCLDGDRAGKDAAVRQLENALRCAGKGRRIRFLFLPDGEDPDSLVRKRGIEALQHLLERDTAPLSEFLFLHLCQDLNLEIAEDRAHLIEQMEEHLQYVDDSVFRQQLVLMLAERTRLPYEELEKILKKRIKPQASLPPANQEWNTPQSQEEPPPPVDQEWNALQSREESLPPASAIPQSPRPGKKVSSPTWHLIGLLLHDLKLAAQLPENFVLFDESEEGQALMMLYKYQRDLPGSNAAQLFGEIDSLDKIDSAGEQEITDKGLQILLHWRSPERIRMLQKCRASTPQGGDQKAKLQQLLHQIQRKKSKERHTELLQEVHKLGNLDTPESQQIFKQGIDRTRELKQKK